MLFRSSRETHPIWRGIGCILILIVPLLSFAGAALLVNYGLSQGWPIPPEWLGYINFPDWVWKIQFLASITGPIASYNNLKAVLAFFFVVLMLLTGIYSTVYAFIYRGLVLQRNVAKVIPLACHSEHPALFRVRRISVLRRGDPSGAQNAPSG